MGMLLSVRYEVRGTGRRFIDSDFGFIEAVNN